MIISFCLHSINPWLSGFFSNLGTGVYGSIIVYYLVERSLDRSREEIACNRMRRPISDLFELLLKIYKASRTMPEVLPTSYHELFTGDYFDNIRYLDMKQDAPVRPTRSWAIYTNNEIIRIKSQFSSIIDVYGIGLNNELLVLMEAIMICPTFNFFMWFPKLMSFYDGSETKYKYPTFLNDVINHIENDVPKFLQLLDYMNDRIANPVIIDQNHLTDRFAPVWGKNRSKDLNIETIIKIGTPE